MRAGDGTGMGTQPPEEPGLSHVGGDHPEKPGGVLKHGGSGSPHHDGPQRTSHPRGGGSSDGGK